MTDSDEDTSEEESTGSVTKRVAAARDNVLDPMV